jgi:dTDP-4-dehydrorhamnose reductase
MKILITGADGQLGLALQRALSGHDLLPLDHARLDVTDSVAVHKAIVDARPDAVIHAAAWTDTANCERDPERAILVNATGARNVAVACCEAGAMMLHVSTNEVFDGEKDAPYDEDDAPKAINAYGRSKLAGEVAVRETLPEHYIVRTSWLYGPGRASFPEKVLQNAREHGRLRLVTDEVASPTLTGDLAAAIGRLIETREFGIYHLTNEGECSRQEWAEEVLRVAGVEVPIEATTQEAFGLPYRKPAVSALANNRAAKLGITLRPWRAALRDHMHAAAGARA